MNAEIRPIKTAAETALAASFATASGEADAAFGDGRVYVERYIENARHVEVQLLALGGFLFVLGWILSRRQ